MDTLDYHIIKGLQEVAQPFSHIFMDIWGVLHNGRIAFEGVADCLESLRRANKKVILFSNAPRMEDHIKGALQGFGIGAHLYTAVMSSGIYVHKTLTMRPPNLGEGKAYVVGTHSDPLTGLNYSDASSLEESDFLFVTGPHVTWDYPQDYKDIFHQAIDQKLPMVCANPDPYVMISGRKVLCAGALGQLYEEMGGKVMWYGKPHAPFYLSTLTQFKVKPQDVLAIGDSMWTDIKGAASLDIATVLVLKTGVHQEEVTMEPESLKRFLEGFTLRPSYVIDALRW